MEETLQDVLQSERPVALGRIERALTERDDLDVELDAVLSALILRRRTSGETGLLGSVLSQDCAERLPVLPDHLEAIGADEAAAAVRDFRREIPLEDHVVARGLIDWLDTKPEIADAARRLDRQLDRIDENVWMFLRERVDELPEIPLPPERRSLLSRLRDSIVGV